VSPALAADSKDVSAGMQLFLLERSAASAEKKVAFRRRNRLISPEWPTDTTMPTCLVFSYTEIIFYLQKFHRGYRVPHDPVTSVASSVGGELL
jgi:hypothetical protein